MFEESYPNLPAGLSMALMMNERAQAGYDRLSEAEKEHIILKCKMQGRKKKWIKLLILLVIFKGIKYNKVRARHLARAFLVVCAWRRTFQ